MTSTGATTHRPVPMLQCNVNVGEIESGLNLAHRTRRFTKSINTSMRREVSSIIVFVSY